MLNLFLNFGYDCFSFKNQKWVLIFYSSQKEAGTFWINPRLVRLTENSVSPMWWQNKCKNELVARDGGFCVRLKLVTKNLMPLICSGLLSKDQSGDPDLWKASNYDVQEIRPWKQVSQMTY